MECSAALPKPGILPILSWTDADSLTLEQICKDLWISETELDPFMLNHPAQFQADVLKTLESERCITAVFPKTTRMKSTKKLIKLSFARIYAQRLPNGNYQKLRPRALPEKSSSACLILWRRALRRSTRRGQAHPTRPRRVRWWVVVAQLLHPLIWHHWFTLLLFLII